MKFAIIGYGKMGHEIQRIITLRGGEVVLIIDADNQHDMTAENLRKADVAIEFSTPHTAFDNITTCLNAGVAVVSGTTGWVARKAEIEQLCALRGGRFFWASNFSIGVNLFFRVSRALAEMMNRFSDYDVTVEEIHHTQKKDAPSGTAITIAEDILSGIDRKNRWELGATTDPDAIGIASLRRSTVCGTHSVVWESDDDSIELIHTAKSRAGLAVGAVLAAEYLAAQPSGVYSMSDML